MIPLQDELRPVLPTVYGPKDFNDFRDQLEQIDELLGQSGLEVELVKTALEAWQKKYPNATAKRIKRVERYLFCAVRCNIARHLTGEAFRPFAIRLADSHLLQKFCGLLKIDEIRPPSKSSLERFDKAFEPEALEKAIRSFMSNTLEEETAQKLGLSEVFNVETVLADTTCIKVNIHFPTDWVLLRDAVKTLIGSIKLIRGQGLTHRMPQPAAFTSRMNNLAIVMTHSGRKKGSRKQRKETLRKMKKLSKVVEKHAKRYRDMLDENWGETDWSRAQADQVLQRIDGILDQLPEAIRQAHERIIGGRLLDNAEKILSLYEEDVHVIKRNKAGCKVEFGNGFYLAEQTDGLLIDWSYFQDQSPGDATMVKESLQRLQEAYGPIGEYITDRGFSSDANHKLLETEEIYDGICPKRVDRLVERMKEARFVRGQHRRAQTEGRIGIFKHVFLEDPMRSKGWEHRNNTLLWCILTHNLWIIARKVLADEALLKQAA